MISKKNINEIHFFVSFILMMWYNLNNVLRGDIMKNKNEKKKNPSIVTKTRFDNAVEVEIRKSPSKTKSGRLLIYIILFAMVLLPLIGLIIVLASL